MAGHPPAPRTELEEEIDPHVGGEDQDNQTSDDKLATDLYKDYSSQNNTFGQVMMALSAFGIGEAKNIRDAYAFFAKNQIDPEKLIKDPVYRAQIKEHVKRLNFWEKSAVKNGRSKLGAVLDGTNKAIKEVDATNKKLVDLKENLIKDYSTELQNLYGLSKNEIDAITQRVKYAVQKDPSLSMQDLMQQEGQVIARKRIENEGKKEKLTPEQIEGKIKTSLSKINERFFQRTAVAGGFEENSHFELTYNCKQKLDEVIIQPPAAPQPQPVPSPQLVNPPLDVTPLPTIPPSIPISPPMISAIPIPGSYSLRNVPIPSFGGFKTGLNILGSGFGKLLGGMGKFIGRRGLGRFINLAANLGKRAINRALDAFMPGLGMTVGKINDVIKSIIGVDVEKTILVGAAILVGAVATVAIILPLIIGVGVFSYITGNNPLKLSYSNEKTIGWNEFNKQYLTINNIEGNNQLSAGYIKNLTWQQFEKENLTPSQRYLSLENIAK